MMGCGLGNGLVQWGKLNPLILKYGEVSRLVMAVMWIETRILFSFLESSFSLSCSDFEDTMCLDIQGEALAL